jgi:folate-dependent phosphoribosylglycinamide formyltransferase PurN
VKVAILCQEEPVFLGPFLCGVLRLRPQAVCAVFIAGRRSAGEKHATRRERLDALRIFWLLMEPAGFLRSLALRLRARLLGEHDRRSVAGAARRLGIPVYPVRNPNASEFHERLRRLAPDVVLNQSERLLRQEVLAVPRLGFLNRHASLLPLARGRLGGFWSHAAEPPRYGLTFHRVDEGVDTGPIVLQQEFADVDPAWSYPRVMARLMRDAPALFWEAVDRLAQPGFQPQPHVPVDAPHLFPTLAQARTYRQRLRARRARATGMRRPCCPTWPRSR